MKFFLEFPSLSRSSSWLIIIHGCYGKLNTSIMSYTNTVLYFSYGLYIYLYTFQYAVQQVQITFIHTYQHIGISVSGAAVCSRIWRAYLESVNTYRPAYLLSLVQSMTHASESPKQFRCYFQSHLWVWVQNLPQFFLLLFDVILADSHNPSHGLSLLRR